MTILQKYKKILKEKKKQRLTWLILSEKQNVEIENVNIELMSNLMEITIELKIEYVDNIIIGIRNYFEIENNDVWELIPKVEIEKLMSLRYFNNQLYIIFN